jgi:hypothetical protein
MGGGGEGGLCTLSLFTCLSWKKGWGPLYLLCDSWALDPPPQWLLWSLDPLLLSIYSLSLSLVAVIGKGQLEIAIRERHRPYNL